MNKRSGSKIWHMMGKKIFNLLHINGLCPLFTSNRIPSRRFLTQIWILKTLFYDVLILSSIFVLMTVSSDALLVSLACLFCYESSRLVITDEMKKVNGIVLMYGIYRL